MNLFSTPLNRKDFHLKAYYALLIVAVVSMPLSYAVNSISMILLAINWIAEGQVSEKFKKAFTSPLILLFMSGYLLYIVGMIYTSNINEGFAVLQKKLPLLLFPLVIGTSVPMEKKDVERMLWFFVLACFIASVICFVNAFYRTLIAGQAYSFDPQSNYKEDFFFYHGFSRILIHAIYFATYLALCSIFIIQYVYSHWSSLSKIKRTLLLLLLHYLLLIIFMLSSRITIISLFLIFFFGILWYFYKSRKIIQGVGVLAIIFLIFSGVIFFTPALKARFDDVFNSSFKFENNPATNAQLSGKLDGVQMRLANWQFTIMAGEDSWFLGKGTGDGMDALLETYLKNNFYEGYAPKYNPHNQFLQTWLNIGIPGLLALLLSFIVASVLAIRRQQYIYIAFLILIAFFCLTESVLERQHGVVFYAFFNSLFVFSLFKKKA